MRITSCSPRGWCGRKHPRHSTVMGEGSAVKGFAKLAGESFQRLCFHDTSTRRSASSGARNRQRNRGAWTAGRRPSRNGEEASKACDGGLDAPDPPIAEPLHGVPFGGQELVDELGDVGIVFDDEHQPPEIGSIRKCRHAGHAEQLPIFGPKHRTQPGIWHEDYVIFEAWRPGLIRGIQAPRHGFKIVAPASRRWGLMTGRTDPAFTPPRVAVPS